VPNDPNHFAVTIDAHYMHPGRAAAFLLVDSGEAAFVDAGTRFSVPYMMEALRGAGLSPGQVRYILVTHVHLDHSGGAARLAQECEDATVVCHPRSEKHLVDPSKLIASARPVYGDARFAELYGKIEGIDAASVKSVADGGTLPLGKCTLSFMDAPGHAPHHYVVHDLAANEMFTGDAYGLSYPALQGGTRPYFSYVCAPPQFEPDVARATIRRIMATNIRRVHLTHYGPSDAVQAGGEQLLEAIDAFDAAVERLAALELEGEALLEQASEEALQITKDELGKCGLDAEDREILRWALSEHSVTSQGLQVLALRRRNASAEAR
jgi:glyoxylase-like metal-dependent hydrolase (beta-lactamase superfamily II)